MPSQPQELIFPLKGLDEGWAFGRQPPGTTPDCQNVCPFDPLESRARGGQRPGLSKYFGTRHNGTETLQELISIADTTITDLDVTETFTQANGVLGNTDWYPCQVAANYANTSGSYPYVSGNKIVHDDTTASGSIEAAGFHKTAKILRSTFTMTMDVSYVIDTDGYLYAGFIIHSVAPTFPDFWAGSWRDITFRWWNDGGLYKYRIEWNGVSEGWQAETIGSGDWKDHTWWTTARELKLVMDGETGSLYAAGTLMETYDPLYAVNTGASVGFYMWKNDKAANAITIDNWTFTNHDSQSLRCHKIVAISGGDIFTGNPRVALIAATGGTNAVNTSGRVRGEAAFGAIYFADGDPAHYKLWTASTDAVTVWTPTAGTLPMGSDQTAVNITAATPATPSFTVAEDWSGRAAGDYLLVAGSTSNDGYYTIASIAGTGPTVLTVNEAVADNTADGTIQYQNKACKIIKLYRGRIVMAGLETDPQNWFMATVGDALDWDYGATPTTAIMAVAGNNTDVGEAADIITCLAPYSDDLMFIGGDHTLWLMRGDPAASGVIDNISYQTGISGPDAFAFDPDGVFYFFGMGTLWRIVPNGLPEPISRGRLDAIFGDIDLSVNTVHLTWDNKRHGLFIFIVPEAEGSMTSYYWDRRTDSFWKFVYPDACGPASSHTFDGDKPDDNALLFGSWDGYVLRVDPDADNDFGTAVDSYIYYPIIAAGHPLRRTRLNRLTAVLDTNSDDVDLSIYAEDTVQKALEATTVRVARTLSGGRNAILARVAGDAIAIKLSNATVDENWAIENLVAHTEVTGRVRKNQL